MIPGEALRPIVDEDGAVRGGDAYGRPTAGTFDIESEMVLDCSGQHTYLRQCRLTGPKFVGNYDKQIAIFRGSLAAIREGMPSQEGIP